MTVNAMVVTIILGTILPILVGLITKLDAPSGMKGAILIVLNAVQAGIVSATTADGSASFTTESLVLFAFGIATSLSTYYGVYKPLDVPSKLAPEFGIGTKAE